MWRNVSACEIYFSYSAVKRFANMQFALLRQTDAPHKFGETRIGAQRVQVIAHVELSQTVIASLISLFQPCERLLLLTQTCVKGGDTKLGYVCLLRSRQQLSQACLEKAVPASLCVRLFHFGQS